LCFTKLIGGWQTGGHSQHPQHPGSGIGGQPHPTGGQGHPQLTGGQQFTGGQGQPQPPGNA